MNEKSVYQNVKTTADGLIIADEEGIDSALFLSQ